MTARPTTEMATMRMIPKADGGPDARPKLPSSRLITGTTRGPRFPSSGSAGLWETFYTRVTPLVSVFDPSLRVERICRGRCVPRASTTS